MGTKFKGKSKTLSEIKCIDEMDIAGRVVFIRVDFNTPMVDGKISDDTRIRAALPTIEYAINAGAKVVLGSHFGRPKGKYDKKYSLEPVADRLSELSSCEVLLVEEPTSEAPKALLKTLKPKQILLLENLRPLIVNGIDLSDLILIFLSFLQNIRSKIKFCKLGRIIFEETHCLDLNHAVPTYIPIEQHFP